MNMKFFIHLEHSDLSHYIGDNAFIIAHPEFEKPS